MKTKTLFWMASALAAVAALVGCATRTPAFSDAEIDAATQQALATSFREQGIAKLDRLKQDETQAACSATTEPTAEAAKKITEANLASVKWPTDGRYLGDWREGEKLAQNGRGMTWTDAAGSAAGGNCYNCHQIDPKEIAYGTLGPSLAQYGPRHGVKDPADPAAQPVVRYTWGKLWNAKAYMACSAMPRFGHVGALNEAQLRDLMALLLDPNSPVNR